MVNVITRVFYLLVWSKPVDAKEISVYFQIHGVFLRFHIHKRYFAVRGKDRQLNGSKFGLSEACGRTVRDEIFICIMKNFTKEVLHASLCESKQSYMTTQTAWWRVKGPVMI